MSAPCNSNEMAERITALADGELRGADEAELKDHLDQCADCARHYEAEANTKQLVRRATAGASAPAHLHARILTAVRSETTEDPSSSGETQSQRRHRYLSYLAAAAAITLAIGLRFFMPAQAVPTAQGVLQGVGSHTMSLEQERPPLQIVTSDPNELRSFFRNAGADVSLPDFRTRRISLNGGRRCTVRIQKSQVTLYCAQYSVQGTPVYLIVTRGQTLPREGLKVHQHGERTYYSCCVGEGQQRVIMIVWSQKDMLYTLASRLPEERLLAMLPAD
jgi:mycothiol system anti-sigma-R factor